MKICAKRESVHPPKVPFMKQHTRKIEQKIELSLAVLIGISNHHQCVVNHSLAPGHQCHRRCSMPAWWIATDISGSRNYGTLCRDRSGESAGCGTPINFAYSGSICGAQALLEHLNCVCFRAKGSKQLGHPIFDLDGTFIVSRLNI